MKRNLLVLLTIGVVAMGLGVADAGAGIPRLGARCETLWTNPYFRGNVLTVRGTIRCTRPMRSIKGKASLLRVKLGADEQLGAPSPQASAHDDFFLVQSSYYAFQVSHVCKHSAVSYKWWFTIQATWLYRAPFKPQTRQGFSHTVITDCG